MFYTVPPQNGRRFIVTGANSGTGREAARRLALAGAEVVLAVRSLEKGEVAKAAILQEAPGAALDVHEQEPLPGDHPLRTMDNVILTPHVAYYSEESTLEARRQTCENLVRFFRGEEPISRVA